MGDGLAVQTRKVTAIAGEISAQKRAESTICKVNEVLSAFAERDYDHEILTAVRRFPASAAEFAEWPVWVEQRLREVYRAKGIAQPYTHQAEAAEAVHRGKNVVIV